MKKIVLIGISLLFVVLAYAATSYTTHYDLAKPADGDSGWGNSYRTNMDTIDTQMYINATGIQDHITDAVGAHAATAISTSVGALVCTSATTVQAYLDCLDGQVGAITGGTVVTTNTNQTITGLKTFTSAITGTGGASIDGIITFPSITSGVVKADGSGILSTGLVDLTSDVTGVLPLANGGTGSSSFTDTRIPVSNGSILTEDNRLWLSSDRLKLWGLDIGTDADAVETTSSGLVTLLTGYNNATRAPTVIIENNASSSNGLSNMQFRKRNSTSDVSNGDVLGLLSFSGYVNGAYPSLSNSGRGSAAVEVVVDGAPGTNAPGKINFYTGTSSAQPVLRASIDSAGNFLASNSVGIGTVSPLTSLHLESGSSVANYIRVGSVSSVAGFDFGIDASGNAQLLNNLNTNLNVTTNSLQRMRITSGGSVVIGDNAAALGTGATDGFLYVTTSAGAPVGTPTTQAGSTPIHVDTTNNDFYFYSGAQWRKAGGAVSLQGNRQTASSISAGTSLAPTSGQANLIFVAGNGGAVTVTATPPISVTSISVGTTVKICGTSDTNTVTYNNGDNLVLNGSVTLGKDDCISLDYLGSDGTNSAYVETGRNN